MLRLSFNFLMQTQHRRRFRTRLSSQNIANDQERKGKCYVTDFFSADGERTTTNSRMQVEQSLSASRSISEHSGLRKGKQIRTKLSNYP